MAHIAVRDEGIDLDSPTLIEGLPGVGLVGKIAADHLVEEFDMTYFAHLVCGGIPKLAVYRAGSPGLQLPVRLYADEGRDLIVLQSDVPISPQAASDFASCVTGWIVETDVTPVFLSGLPTEKSVDRPNIYGVSTGTGDELLAGSDIPAPDENGVIAGPTGALLHEAGKEDVAAVGLIVESDPQFPDPEAAHVLLEDGVEVLTGIEVDTGDLVDRAEEIREQREKLAKRMQEAGEESTRAEPLRGFQ